MTTEQLKKKLTEKKKMPKAYVEKLSSSLTVLNLLCSGKATWAFRAGTYVMFVGKSRAGKTWLLKAIMAEACRNPDFDEYELIEDKPERGDLMDVKKYFGEGLVKRLRPPTKDGASKTLEGFYDNVREASESGKRFIYGLDSEDALPPEADVLRAKVNKAARKRQAAGKETELKGSMGAHKAKTNSMEMRTAHNLLENGSMLFVLKQTRQNMGWNAQFNPDVRSGGEALTFYATHELWFSIKRKIKRKVRGKERVIGTVLRIEVKKNRVSGREGSVLVHFYPGTGLDETGTNVEFLCEEGHWETVKDKGAKEIKSVAAPEFSYEGSLEGLIQKIESEGKERELRLLVADIWRQIDDECIVTRKPRYA